MLEKKKKCPECSYTGHSENFCAECGADIKSVVGQEVCWIVLRAVGTGFNAMGGRYESLDELLNKAGPLSKLVQNWLILTFVGEIAVGKTLYSINQHFVTSDRMLKDVTKKTYKLVE